MYAEAIAILKKISDEVADYPIAQPISTDSYLPESLKIEISAVLAKSREVLKEGAQ
jgi:hypothetical protein